MSRSRSLRLASDRYWASAAKWQWQKRGWFVRGGRGGCGAAFGEKGQVSTILDSRVCVCMCVGGVTQNRGDAASALGAEADGAHA